MCRRVMSLRIHSPNDYSSGSDGSIVDYLCSTTSERSEPSSRIFLIGEQPNPWDLLQPQDKMSRHRNVVFVFYY